MDAPRLRFLVLSLAFLSLGASYRTQNFVVSAPTTDQAEQIGKAAEKFRRELAMEWLGQAMPNWSEPCPITAQVGDQLGAGGATSFVFDHGEVFGWRMTIQGSLVRILDSVLPHEVTHTIFATHFRQPLPRWADEGACTTVEHSSERNKQSTMLIDFLRTGRGIAFARMFAMKEYPKDVMPLYSQGYSLARYLIAQGGRRKFLEYVGDGLEDNDWTRATYEHYSVSSLPALQEQWLAWVRNGSPNLEPKRDSSTLLASTSGASGGSSVAESALPSPREEAPAPRSTKNSDPPSVYQVSAQGRGPRPDKLNKEPSDWHAPRETTPASELAQVGNSDPQVQLPGPSAASLGSTQHSMSPDSMSPGEVPIPSPVPYQVTRPQGIQRPRQVILEWSRPPQGAIAP